VLSISFELYAPVTGVNFVSCRSASFASRTTSVGFCQRCCNHVRFELVFLMHCCCYRKRGVVNLMGLKPNSIFLQCFDTVGWVIWPLKTRPQYDLSCVWWDVKPSLSIYLSLLLNIHLYLIWLHVLSIGCHRYLLVDHFFSVTCLPCNCKSGCMRHRKTISS